MLIYLIFCLYLFLRSMNQQPEVVEAVEVQLELGHNAVPKPRNQFTHQWTLFVRGPDNCRIEEFVEKVVFNLHESFPKPRRGESTDVSLRTCNQSCHLQC